ncbi:hypothetical protein B5P43_30435 [Bacillus sp. SRB_336]|nr:hypothetical protein B5P43_30435 [Bacillus sp. SRB_336]
MGPVILNLDFPYAVAICDSSLRGSARKDAFNTFTAPGMDPSPDDPQWQSTYPQEPPLRQEDLVAAARLLPSKAAPKSAMSVVQFSSALSGSAGESMSRAKMHMFGFPPPTLQKHFTLRDGRDAGLRPR